ERQRRTRRARRGFDDVWNITRAFLARRRINELIVEIIQLGGAVSVRAKPQALQIFFGDVAAVGGQIIVLPVGNAFQFAETQRAREFVFNVHGRLGVMRQLLFGLFTLL